MFPACEKPEKIATFPLPLIVNATRRNLQASSAGLPRRRIAAVHWCRTCATMHGRLNEAEPDSGVAWRHRWRRGVDCVGLFYRDAAGSALRGHAEAGIVPEGAALPAVHADLDSAHLRDVDSDRASLRVGSRHRRPRTKDGAKNRNDRWLLRRCARQLRSSRLVPHSSSVTPRMDAGFLDRLNLRRPGRWIFIQRVRPAPTPRTRTLRKRERSEQVRIRACLQACRKQSLRPDTNHARLPHPSRTLRRWEPQPPTQWDFDLTPPAPEILS